MTKHTNIIAAYLALFNQGKILLLERQNTGYHDGDFSLIAGHIDPGETFTQGVIREAHEEAGITLQPHHLQVAHVMHRKSAVDQTERVDVFFTATKWQGTIRNMEPQKCSQLKWFYLDNLPDKIIPCVRKGLSNIQNKITYSEFGW